MLRSDTQRQIVVFTLSWEDTVDAVYKKKKKKEMLRYTELAAEVEKCGWKARLRPRCWGNHSRGSFGMRCRISLRDEFECLKVAAAATEWLRPWTEHQVLEEGKKKVSDLSDAISL